MGFKKAKKEQVWLKVLLSGASGSGKSYSALRLATGIYSKCGGSGIAYIGTEGSRDKYYANEFDYDLCQLQAPYTADKYLAELSTAIKEGYKVIIIDSMSHEWQWLNDVHDKMPGNSFQNWGKLKPTHKKFMDTILQSPIHVIACVRGRTEWTLEEDEKGKKVPKKLGLGSFQDKDISYEYTLSFVIEQSTHIASADKDNTRLFDGVYEVLTEEDGVKLFNWANDGETPAPAPVVQEGNDGEMPASAAVDQDDVIAKQTLSATISAIISKCGELGGTKNKDMMVVMKEYAPPRGNPNTIKDVDKAKELLEKLNNMPALAE